MTMPIDTAAAAAADLSRQANAAGPLRELPAQVLAPTAPGADTVNVIRAGDAFGKPGGVDRPSVTGVIDRVRADFEAFKLRASRQGDGLVSAPTHRPSGAGRASETERMQTLMNDALRAQVDIFELTVTFNAGLTASQQSQGAVKTLIEKA